jgi:hypothetical protein
MDQFSVLNTIFLYLPPDDYLNCLIVNSLWYEIAIIHFRKLFAWKKSDLIIQWLSKKEQHKRSISTPSVFCNERGVEFTIDRYENLLQLISAYGNSYHFPFESTLGEMTHIMYTIIPSTLRKYYILVFNNDLCTFIIDCSQMYKIRVNKANFEIDKSSIESLSWLYFSTNNIEKLDLDFENNRIIPQDISSNWHQQRFYKSQTKSCGHVIVFGPQFHLVYFVTETDAILKQHLKFDYYNVKDSIMVNDKYYVRLSYEDSVEIINLNDIDEDYQFFHSQSDQLCPLYGDKFMILLWNSNRNEKIQFVVFDISLKKITQNGTIYHNKFPWFQQRAFFYQDTKELFYVKRNHDLNKLKII